MKGKKAWIRLSIFNLSIVAFLGMILRSKMLFAIPFINYNYLLNAHSHFAFGAWATLALLVLMVYDLLPTGAAANEPPSIIIRPAYHWLLGGITLASYGMLFSFLFQGYGDFSIFCSTLFIFITYAIGWLVIRDIRKSGVSKTVRLLAISSMTCLILSSIGPFSLAYLLAIKSLNGLLYRDALFTYLHFQYNGFFTLAVFALLFHQIEPSISEKMKKNFHRFSVFLCLSVVPALFLSYLWQDPNSVLKIIATIGSVLVFLSFILFLICLPTLVNNYKKEARVIAIVGILSMVAFLLKTFLQSLTISTTVGNAVFGDRPMIIGFLHLVFLGFVSLFLLGYFAQNRWLNIESKFTRIALMVFATAVVLNEIILMGQGLGAMFILSSKLFTWLLWIMSICLLVGALLITVTVFKASELKTEIGE